MRRLLPTVGGELPAIEAMARRIGLGPCELRHCPDVPLRMAWPALDGRTELSWVFDDTVELDYLIVDGPGADELTSLVSKEVRPAGWRELLADLPRQRAQGELVPALYRLAVAAPAEPEVEIIRLLAELGGDPDPAVRRAVYVSTGYLSWPALELLLVRAATGETDEEARELVAELLGDAGAGRAEVRITRQPAAPTSDTPTARRSGQPGV
jgi:hypothetical protein